MKKIVAICIIVLFMLGCTKTNTDITNDNTSSQILIKVDAEHNDGSIVSSPIVVVR